MKLRTGIRSKNFGAISFSFSNSFKCKNCENKINVQLDTSFLAPGTYSLELILCQIDSDGNIQEHDGIRNAVFFEVIDDKMNPELKNIKYDWGHLVISSFVSSIP